MLQSGIDWDKRPKGCSSVYLRLPLHLMRFHVYTSFRDSITISRHLESLLRSPGIRKMTMSMYSNTNNTTKINPPELGLHPSIHCGWWANGIRQLSRSCPIHHNHLTRATLPFFPLHSQFGQPQHETYRANMVMCC